MNLFQLLLVLRELPQDRLTRCSAKLSPSLFVTGCDPSPPPLCGGHELDQWHVCRWSIHMPLALGVELRHESTELGRPITVSPIRMDQSFGLTAALCHPHEEFGSADEGSARSQSNLPIAKSVTHTDLMRRVEKNFIALSACDCTSQPRGCRNRAQRGKPRFGQNFSCVVLCRHLR